MSQKSNYSFKRLEIVVHILFWIIYFLYPIIKFGDHDNFSFDLQSAVRNIFLISTTVYAIYFLFDKARNNKLILSVMVVAFLSVIYLYCHLNVQKCNCDVRVCYINSFVEFVFINIFFIALLLIRRNISHQQVLQENEQELMKAELKALKAQINPHFLFNTLNMLYSNALTKDDNLPENILKLSGNLQYLLHEGEKNIVLLNQEVEFIQDYISLQKARLGEKNEVSFVFKSDDSDQLIPPLLLIPFIENAFKFSSITKGNKLPINISIILEKATLKFYVKNLYNLNYKLEQSEIWKSSGIGIKNVQKRLELLYPKKHTLNFVDEEGVFIVDLRIDLSTDGKIGFNQNPKN